MPDGIIPSPPLFSNSPERRRHTGSGPSTLSDASHSVAAGGSSGGTQGSRPGPHKQHSSSSIRRFSPASDEEEDIRPKKKKRRRIIDPDTGAATAGIRVSLDGIAPPNASRYKPPRGLDGEPSATSAGSSTRRTTGVTAVSGNLDGPNHERGTGTRVDRGSDRRTSAAGAPLQRAQERRKSGKPSDLPSSTSNGRDLAGASNNSRHPPPAGVEIINISDDEPVPPPARPAVSKKPSVRPRAPQSKATPSIPRRTKFKSAPKPPKYKEDENGVILLDIDEDEPSARRDSTRAPTPATDASLPLSKPSRTLAEPPVGSATAPQSVGRESPPPATIPAISNQVNSEQPRADELHTLESTVHCVQIAAELPEEPMVEEVPGASHHPLKIMSLWMFSWTLQIRSCPTYQTLKQSQRIMAL
ncbi:hypothetical protein C2E23DRAFT_26607 [Lenzites betulinus]|nr:hypothetical protein C2E23DRAFT_26607 [Lenzites betulinus]